MVEYSQVKGGDIVAGSDFLAGLLAAQQLVGGIQDAVGRGRGDAYL